MTKQQIVLLRRAFFDSIPVLMGYLAMGFAAGVLLTATAGLQHPVLWAGSFAALCISGTLQFAVVDWIRTASPLLQVAFLTVCINMRYSMYGLSLLTRFQNIPRWQKWYLIGALTDETYALEVGCRLPGKQKILYCLLLSAMNHAYWIIGVTAGAMAGAALPFSNKGIDFAMTALFIVILTDQCRKRENRIPALIGGGAAFCSLLIFGAAKMLIPTIGLIVLLFFALRKSLDPQQKEANRG